jgi:UDPglucose 6-dehydrogenase
MGALNASRSTNTATEPVVSNTFWTSQSTREGKRTKLFYRGHRDEALDEADALAIVTEWKHFINPDFDRMRRAMRQPVIFDGRNLYRPERMKQAGFTYYSIGRPAV